MRDLTRHILKLREKRFPYKRGQQMPLLPLPWRADRTAEAMWQFHETHTSPIQREVVAPAAWALLRKPLVRGLTSRWSTFRHNETAVAHWFNVQKLPRQALIAQLITWLERWHAAHPGHVHRYAMSRIESGLQQQAFQQLHFC